MSKFGDELFRRLQRIKAGLEPATQPGRRCARCRKDMSNRLVIFEPTPDDVCDQCAIEIRKEEYIARWKAAKPPEYDIDAILNIPGGKAWDMVSELNSKIDPACPEVLLFEPELVVRDFEEFSCFKGHGFGYIFGFNGGVHDFLHGLRAMRAIGAKHLADCISSQEPGILRLAEELRFPTRFLTHGCATTSFGLDSEMERDLGRLTEELKPYDGLKGGDLHEMLVTYFAHSRGRSSAPKEPVASFHSPAGQMVTHSRWFTS